VLGVVMLGEAATPLRVISAALILAGIVGLKLASE
jgi:quaternary ammonium compound-resistance protein SugE